MGEADARGAEEDESADSPKQRRGNRRDTWAPGVLGDFPPLLTHLQAQMYRLTPTCARARRGHHGFGFVAARCKQCFPTY